MNQFHKKTTSGFTLVELVMTLVIIGILAATALPRFFNKSDFENRGFYTEVINAVRYAQQLAVATNCDVQVTLGADSYTVNIWSGGDCGSVDLTGPAPDPVTGTPSFTNSNNSITITSMPAVFTFDALGTTPADVTVTMTGGYSFTVHAATGYIEEL